MQPVQKLSALLVLPVGVVLALVCSSAPASAAPADVGLGTAGSFAVLAGQSVSNTGPTVLSGDLGVSPSNAVTGFPPGTVVNGSIHTDAVAAQAQSDLTTAYDDAAGRPFTVDKTGIDLGNSTLVAGVYRGTSELALTGTVTLDAQGDPDAVFIFQAGSTLKTASASNVALVNGAQACHVFWQVGSSATLGSGSTLVGTVMALTSATVLSGTTVQGRVLARNGSVSLDDARITRPTCAGPAQTPSPSPSATPSAAPSTTPSTTTSAGSSPGTGGTSGTGGSGGGTRPTGGSGGSGGNSGNGSGDGTGDGTVSTSVDGVPIPVRHPRHRAARARG